MLKHRYGTIAHVMTGAVLILKGYAKITDHYAGVGSMILCFGLVIIGYVIYESRRKSHSPLLVMAVHFFEGLALLFTTYVYIDEGKTYIQYLTLAAAIGFFVAVLIMYMRYKKSIPHPLHHLRDEKTANQELNQ
ncbi:MAG TPA: hypothetical protein PLD84_15700 [Chitinophagales bacterium]|nr:hypothetical protein [Chitinophagales bacterium]